MFDHGVHKEILRIFRDRIVQNFKIQGQRSSPMRLFCEGENLVWSEGVYIAASDISQAAVNCLAFTYGTGFRVTLDQLSIDGVSSLLRLDAPPEVATITSDLDAGAMWDQVLVSPPLFMALHDLIEAIHAPHCSVVNCARAVEGLRDWLTDPAFKRAQKWRAFNAALRLDPSYSTLITNSSLTARHGDRSYIEGVVVTEVTKRAWTIMRRCLDLDRKKVKELPPTPEFPVLFG